MLILFIGFCSGNCVYTNITLSGIFMMKQIDVLAPGEVIKPHCHLKYSNMVCVALSDAETRFAAAIS